MQYLIVGRLLRPELLTLPHTEFVELIHTKMLPALKQLVSGSTFGKMLAGGMTAGGQTMNLIVDLEANGSHRCVRHFLDELPIFPYYAWEVTPLEPFAEMLEPFQPG